ncbi:protein Gawky-like isoform X2 [Littorina saxatilis]|uniref:protein Gawky-like isoform X2 n=1 Tax=Littorina saxatilis TaxID=31220 RepID=UPI0038B43028
MMQQAVGQRQADTKQWATGTSDWGQKPSGTDVDWTQGPPVSSPVLGTAPNKVLWSSSEGAKDASEPGSSEQSDTVITSSSSETNPDKPQSSSAMANLSASISWGANASTAGGLDSNMWGSSINTSTSSTNSTWGSSTTPGSLSLNQGHSMQIGASSAGDNQNSNGSASAGGWGMSPLNQNSGPGGLSQSQPSSMPSVSGTLTSSQAGPFGTNTMPWQNSKPFGMRDFTQTSDSNWNSSPSAKEEGGSVTGGLTDQGKMDLAAGLANLGIDKTAPPPDWNAMKTGWNNSMNANKLPESAIGNPADQAFGQATNKPLKPMLPVGVLSPKEEEIRRAIDTHEGWGTVPVRQDTTWDIESSPKASRKVSTDNAEMSSSNVWNNTNGTAIWESTREAQAPGWVGGAAAGGGGGNIFADKDPHAWSMPPKPGMEGGGNWGGGGGNGNPNPMAPNPMSDKSIGMWGGESQSSSNKLWGTKTETGSWNDPPQARNNMTWAGQDTDVGTWEDPATAASRRIVSSGGAGPMSMGGGGNSMASSNMSTPGGGGMGGNMSGGMGGNMSGGMGGNMSGGMGGNMSGGMGGNMSGGMNSGMGPGMNSGMGSGMNSGMGGNMHSGMGGNMNSGMGGNMNSGMGSGMNSGMGSGMSSGMGSGMSSGMSGGMRPGMSGGMSGGMGNMSQGGGGGGMGMNMPMGSNPLNTNTMGMGGGSMNMPMGGGGNMNMGGGGGNMNMGGGGGGMNMGGGGGGMNMGDSSMYWNTPDAKPQGWNPATGPPRPKPDEPWSKPGMGRPGGGGGWGDPSNGSEKAKAAGWGEPGAMWNPAFGARPKSTSWAGNDPDNWQRKLGQQRFPGSGGGQPQMRSKLLQQLMDMGFKKEEAQNALISNNMNFENALGELSQGMHKVKDLEPDVFQANGGKMPRQGFMPDNPGMMPDDISDNNPHVPNYPMQNTPYNNNAQVPNQPYMPGNMYDRSKGGPPTMPPNNGSINSNQLHKLKVLQQQGGAAPAINSLSPTQGVVRGAVPGSSTQNMVQQQAAQQQILQQLRLAVQSGLISPQLLNQQLPHNILVMLQQLLQLQNAVQNLMQRQQFLQQNKVSLNIPRPQLDQVSVMITQYKAQILALQKQLQAAQQSMLMKQQPPSAPTPTPQQMQQMTQQPPMGMPPPMPGSSMQGEGGEAMMSLGADMAAMAGGANMSRLNQWKQPTPERDGQGDLNKAPGSKLSQMNMQHSHSAPVMGPFGDLTGLNISGDTTWSSSATSAASNWPSASNDGSGDSKRDDSTPPTSGLASMLGGGNLGLSTDVIPEFVPGKPWQGLTNKRVEDDPHITPGSISRSLSVNVVKDDYLNNLSSNKPSPSFGTDATWSMGKLGTTASVDASGNNRGNNGQWQGGGGYNRQHSWAGRSPGSAFTQVSGSGWDTRQSSSWLKNLSSQEEEQ